jgi:hypothetical protein
LAFQRQILRHQAAGKRQCAQNKAANGEFVKGAEIQVLLQWSARCGDPPVTFKFFLL